ncbi:MAG TPA: DUF1353 domain-containing protein [Terriglobia bacterium]|nr:DUF1353 domain-containing protein [Terriglobia bacterium]
MQVSFVAMLLLLLTSQSVRDVSSLDEVHRSGVFYGTLKLQPTGDGVHMKVLELYSYKDAYGHILSAQPGFPTDGASIPRALWTVVGSPFTGKYVGAAVIHDVGCESHKYSWQVTDRMFYDAMLDLGVGNHLAKLMYYGVRLGGPKWESVTLAASTEAELKAKIAESGAISITETSGTTNQKHLAARVIVPYPKRAVTDSELREFDQELAKREKENNPISLAEIDDRTAPKTLPRPAGAVQR